MGGLEDLRALAQRAWDNPGTTVRGSVQFSAKDWEAWQAMLLEEEPDLCQQFGCSAEADSWCPLCRGYFCAQHDDLWPIRRHDCLRGKAEVPAQEPTPQ